MGNNREVELPAICRLLTCLAGRLVPGEERRSWRRRRERELSGWWVLAERGELPRGALPAMIHDCLLAFGPAFWLRFNRDRFRSFVRGPVFPAAVTAVVMVVVAVLTHAFAFSRIVLGVESDVSLVRGDRLLEGGLQGAELLFAHLFPTAYALVVGIAMITMEYRKLGRRGFRYWSFLLMKTAGAIVMLPALWIEAGSAMRRHLELQRHEAALLAIGFTLTFTVVFAKALLAVFRDQRARCPVCLHRLSMPVTMGSWSSVLDPVTTELVCEKGHGSLAARDAAGRDADRWVPLDESWRDLFETQRR